MQTSLYHNLFVELESYNEKNIVYVPAVSAIRNVSYKTEYLNKSFSVFDRLLYQRKQNLIFYDICKKEYLSDIKLLHAHTLFSAGYAAYRISKKMKLKYIVAIRDTDVNIFFKRMTHLRNLGVKIMYNAEQVIFLSEAYKKTVLTKYVPKSKKTLIEEKSIVIPNGIDKYFLENRYYRKIEKQTDSIKILFVGEITRRKNVTETIKACMYLNSRGYKVSYTVVGEIKNTFIGWRLKRYPFIFYHPKCNKEQVLQYMRTADVFVMPSITETFGLVYAEAMSQGLPIIYTKGQGFDGHFKDGEIGFAVNCFDYKMIAQKILEIYSNYDSISERCTSYADRFDWKKIAFDYKEIYNRIVSNIKK